MLEVTERDTVTCAVSSELAKDLTPEVLGEVYARLCDLNSEQNVSDLAGRGVVLFEEHAGRKFVFRRYFRGGKFRLISKNTYFRLPWKSGTNYRPLAELEVLSFLEDKGVSVPKPAAAFVKRARGGLTYEGMLVTEEVPGATNLLDYLTAEDLNSIKEHVEEICHLCGCEAKAMLAAGVYHLDLHLGNVLFDDSGKVFLIDFDKAYHFSVQQELNQKIERLLSRWTRSAEKHLLGRLVTEPFKEGLGI